MTQYISKSAVVAEIKRIEHETNYESFTDEVLGKRCVCRSLLSFLNTLEVEDPYEQCIQYDSVKAGIQANAEIYSFNIESNLFNQLTKGEQQELWRKEIEQAYIIGGETGVELARDIRYKENLEAKEVGLEKEYKDFVEEDPVYNKLVNSIVGKAIAKHFFELGLKASCKDIKNI